MGAVEQIITDNLPLWSSSVQLKSTQGRGSSNKRDLYGIKKLRELILDLAVRGLLVPQDPDDESASTLLEKIEVEKKKLIADGKISKPRKVNSSDELTLPFKLPNGWAFSRLADIGHDWGQKKPDQQFTYIDVGAINKELGIIEKQSILDNSEAPSRARKIVRQGTVIFSTVRPYLLNIAVINKDFTPEPIASTAFAVIHPFSGISSSYLYRYLRSPVFVSYVEDCQTGIAYPAINDKQFFSGLIALPPLAEQNRIVAKVDELMTLCDTLEQQQENSIEAHETLVEILFSALTNAPDAEAFQSAWERVSKHFDTLLTTEHSVDKLKETILQLAVTGKLVPQDPNDEPASVMLEKISADKEHLIKEDKIKKQKSILKIGRDEQPIKLPKSWELVRLGDLSPEFQNGASSRGDKEGIETVVFRLADIENWKISTTDNRYLLIDPKSTARYSIKKNDVLIIRVNGSASIVGRFIFCDTDYEGIYCDHFIRMRFHHEIFSTNYLTLLASSDLVRKSIENMFVSTAGQKTVNQKHIASLLVSIPPLAEQHRIVAKVDELMNLCDDLKQSLNEAQTTQMQLTDAVVENAF